ncbi:MAG: hypothetical protein Kow0010_17640 [Dehalococcoidia bacterium]
MARWLTVKQASEASGLSADTIRFYEREGVLPAPARRANGYRSYPPEHIETLRLARRLRDLGLPMRAIASLVHVYHAGSCRDLRDELTHSLDDALNRVRALRLELERSEQQLAHIVAEVEQVTPTDQRSLAARPCPCIGALAAE